MSTRTTKLTVKTRRPKMSDEDQERLKARAARFGMPSTSRGTTINLRLKNPNATTTAQKVINPADVEKLAARAARFADVNSPAAAKVATSGVVSTSNPVRTTLSSADAELLAKRAARFSGVEMDTQTTSKAAKK